MLNLRVLSVVSASAGASIYKCVRTAHQYIEHGGCQPTKNTIALVKPSASDPAILFRMQLVSKYVRSAKMRVYTVDKHSELCSSIYALSLDIINETIQSKTICFTHNSFIVHPSFKTTAVFDTHISTYLRQRNFSASQSHEKRAFANVCVCMIILR